MREATIVIPQRDGWHFTRDCIALIRRHEPNSPIVVVDNESRTPPPAFGDATVLASHGSLTAAWNCGVGSAQTEFVILLNNDVTCGGPFVEKLCRPGYVSGATMRFDDDCGMFILEGWCLAFERYVWERLAGFDECMELYFQDTDFMRRAAAEGVPVREVDVSLRHLGHRTAHDPAIVDQNWRRQRWAADRAAFRGKWR